MKLLTKEDVADALQVSVSYVEKKLLATGTLQTVRLGRLVRVEPDELQRYIVASRAVAKTVESHNADASVPDSRPILQVVEKRVVTGGSV